MSAQNTNYPADEPMLRANRRAIRDFLSGIAAMDLPEPVLEVGPMVRAGVLERYPEYFVDSRAIFGGRRYLSMDLDPAMQPDVIGDIAELDKVVGSGKIGTVVALSVLEHVPRLWAVPSSLHAALRPGGLVCVQTPWNLRFHGPRPDCWRLSDDGYRALFEPLFEIVSLARTETPGRPLCPVSVEVIMRKAEKPGHTPLGCGITPPSP